MRVALPLLAMLGSHKGSDLTELPDECLLYMSRVGMVGAGKINPALESQRIHRHPEGASLAASLEVPRSLSRCPPASKQSLSRSFFLL